MKNDVGENGETKGAIVQYKFGNSIRSYDPVRRSINIKSFNLIMTEFKTLKKDQLESFCWNLFC